jgi:ATP-binding cassette subfamily B protein
MDIPKIGYWGLLTTYIKPFRRLFYLLAVLILINIGLQIVNPLVVRYFIDSATEQSTTTQTLTYAAIAFLVLATIQQLSAVSSVYVGENLAWSSTNLMRHDLAEHSYDLDMSFHKVKTPGEMIERLDTDISALANFFSAFVLRVTGNSLLLLGILVVMFYEDWRIGAPFTITVMITVAILTYLRNIAIPHWEKAHEASADVFGFLEERLAGTEDIRSAGANEYVFQQFGDVLDYRAKSWKRAWFLNFLVIRSIFMMNAVMLIMAFGIGYYMFTNSLITLGTAYVMVHYTTMLGRPLREISNQIQDLQRAGGSILRVQQMYEIRSKIEDGPGAELPRGPLAVSFENVTFSYDDEKDDDIILHDVSFDLQPGEVLGLLGRTGAGKTTISRLIYRLYDINAGSIKLNGIDIRQPTIDQLRGHVGMVTQDVQIFRASIRDNLTFFNISIPDERILEVLEDLGMKGWLDRQEDGLATMMESGGTSISAGEAQLLAFTRIFLQDPGLIIMDEASSRLDPATELLIEQAVDKLLKNRTGIIIAHRLKTVQRANKIMILENGRVKEFGDRLALMADSKSHFSQLLITGMEEVLV